MSNKPRVFIDCQVFQYDAWSRGMGRYTLKLLEALGQKDLELTIILNKSIGIDKSRLKVISDICPDAAILHLKLSHDPYKSGGWLQLQKICASELDRQLQGLLQPEDTYLIASNFSHSYCSTFPRLACKKSLVFYDLTPYIQWSEYKRDFAPKKYFAQYDTVFAADQLWSISESAADEAKYWLGIDASKVANIRGASIRNNDDGPRRPSKLPDGKFIVSPSADGPNKNNVNMARAFAEFNKQAGGHYKLVITSGFSEQSKATLSSISKDIIFSGYVTDGELSWLYQHCEAVLFVSKTEGLGLPILEGVEADKKVVCSDIKVFKEISSEAFYFANPYDIMSIADALVAALIKEDGWSQKNKLYQTISHKFSWPAVADTCVQLIEAPLPVAQPASSQSTKTIWYADGDKPSLPRDIAEMFYAEQPTAKYRAMRSVRYAHLYPSYLVEMGVAAIAVDSQTMPPATCSNTYLVDDSPEAAKLMLYALLKPGLLVLTFSKQEALKYIDKYLKENFQSQLDAKLMLKLLQQAGNRLVYKPVQAARGGQQFIDEVSSFSQLILQEES